MTWRSKSLLRRSSEISEDTNVSYNLWTHTHWLCYSIMQSHRWVLHYHHDLHQQIIIKPLVMVKASSSPNKKADRLWAKRCTGTELSSPFIECRLFSPWEENAVAGWGCEDAPWKHFVLANEYSTHAHQKNMKIWISGITGGKKRLYLQFLKRYKF